MSAEKGPGGPITLAAVNAGLLAAFVGFASSFAVVVKGLQGVGASQAEAASGLMAAAVAMGLSAIWLSLTRKQPISVAWSTPGAALLATSGVIEGGFPAAVGAFLVCGGLIVLAGFWSRLGRWVAAIPGSLANAMLAGVLVSLCLAPVRAVAEFPLEGLAIVITWLAVGQIKRLLAMPAAVAVTVALMLFQGAGTADIQLWQDPVLVTPVFNLQALIGIALPLFIVTMASQNIPGIAILKVNGYEPPPGPLFRNTGLFSLAGAPFGSHAVNLAAITAAICAGEEACPDRNKRYWSAIVAGGAYILLGLLAGAATAFIAASPAILIEAVAGLALLGAFGGALLGAMQEAKDREAAVITFLVTASGISFWGISGAFWGLVAGGLVLAVTRWRAAQTSK